MIYKVMSIRDLKAEVFLPTFTAINIGQAVRNFTDAVNDSSTPVAKHPEDYQLFEVATFDDATGLFEVVSPVRLILSAKEAMNNGSN